MKKDMINLDDLFKEKLNNPTKRSDEDAAWIKMKSLLDEKMPEKAVPFMFRWSKPMAFLGISLLLAGLCVGGYELIALRGIEKEKTQSNSSFVAEKEILNQNANDDIDQVEKNLENGNLNSHLASENKTENKSINKSNSNTQSNSISSSSNQKLPDLKISSTTQKSLANEKKPIVSKQNENFSEHTDIDLNQHKKQKQNLLGSTNGVIPKSNHKNLGSEIKNKADSKGEKLTLASNNARIEVKRIKDANQIDEQIISSKDEIGSLKDNTILAPGNTTGAVQNPNQLGQIDKPNGVDSMPMLSTVKKVKSSKTFPKEKIIQEDTVAQNKIAISNAPANKDSSVVSPTKPAYKNNTHIVSQSVNEFGASSKNVNESKSNTSSVAKKKVKRPSFIEKLNIAEGAENLKKDLGNAQLYFGFLGGLNYSLSNQNNFQGIQFGPTSELVINDHWSLFASVKYFNRSGGKKTIYDSYSKESTTDTPYYRNGNNWNYFISTDSTSRYFKFSTLHSFELPITIRYTLKKFYLMTGLNLAYYLGVNVEEVKKEFPAISIQNVQTNATKPILSENKPDLDISDFGSRFGLGYVVGAGYQIDPSWQVDLRFVSTFWDNAKGDGAKKLSKDFYKLPSLQISIGYQFNRGKSKPTFGPNSNQ